MPSWPKPTPEQIDKAVALLKRPAQTAYFFDRLNNPNWIEPLAAAGLFKQPPDIVFDGTGTRWSAPPWPQTRYLARMAGLTPEPVLKVLSALPKTRNPLVRSDIVDALIQMPASMGASMLKRIEPWCAEPYFLLADKLRKLIGHLGEGGEQRAALRLSRKLLATQPSRSTGTTPLLFPEAVSVLAQWDYESVLRTIAESLLPHASLATVLLLRDLLIEAVTGASRTDQLEADYLSYTWRSAIEDHEQNSEAGGVKSLLVSALRDSSVWIVENGVASLPILLERLNRTDSTVMLRLHLYLMTRFIDIAPDIAIAALANREYFDSVAVRHEYHQLSAAAFPRADAETQRKVLQWIEAGSDRERISEFLRARTGVEPDPAEVKNIVRIRQRDRMSAFADSLPNPWDTIFANLVREFGRPSHPDFLVWVEPMRTGEVSPLPPGEIAAMAPSEALGFVVQWQPELRPDAPTRSGLAVELRRDVAKRPAEYITEAGQLLKANPTFLRALVEGLDDAGKAGAQFDWTAALELMRSILELPDTAESPIYMGDQDPGLNWTRRAILDLVHNALRRIAFAPSDEATVIEILAILSDDPDPAAALSGDSTARAVDVAINSIRGRAVEALVDYAQWLVAKQLRPSGKAIAGHRVGELLERRLDLNTEKSLAVRSVFGLTLATVLSIDADWLSSHLASYFPDASPHAADVVWDAFISFHGPAQHLYELLQAQYARAIERLPSSESEPGRIGVDYRLGEHLTILYLNGVFPLDGPLTAFFERADLPARTHALEYVGRLLEGMAHKVDSVIERAQALWTLRRNATLGASDAAELVPFGWWFGSSVLSPSWRLLEMKGLLDAELVPEPGFVVLRALKDLAQTHPNESLDVLSLFVERDRPGIIAGAFEEEIRAILEVAIQSGDDATQRSVSGLAHRLGELGYATLRPFAT